MCRPPEPAGWRARRGTYASLGAITTSRIDGAVEMSAARAGEDTHVQSLFAHSANHDGARQLLADHLRNVAALARERAQPFGGGDLAFLAGLWHDAGKADPEWQRYLLESEAGTRTRGSGPDHKSAGALLAEDEREPLVGLLIQAHHGGLPDPRGEHRPWRNEHRARRGPMHALERDSPGAYVNLQRRLEDVMSRIGDWPTGPSGWARIETGCAPIAGATDHKENRQPEGGAARGLRSGEYER